MSLELATFHVRDIVFGKRTEYAHGTLSIDRDELLRRALGSSRLSCEVELARPGESVRITRILDAVEPRAKVDVGRSAFPGFLGPPLTAGRGRTHRLGGMAVLEVGELPVPTRGVLVRNEGVIDMTGPLQPYCACGDTINLCLCFKAPADMSNEEFDRDTRLACLRAAEYLARSTLQCVPDEVEQIDLGPTVDGLPRVAYVEQVQNQGPLVRTYLYGIPMDGNFVPTLLDPTEVLDGAVVSGNYKNMMRACTYLQQNNQVTQELMRRHGHDLQFVGHVIGRGHFDTALEKERQGRCVAKLLNLLGAQAAVMTLEGTGNSTVDYMQTVRAIEAEGMAAVPILHEMGGADGSDVPLVDWAPEARSVVSVGSVDGPLRFPRVERVIGGTEIAQITGDPVARTVSSFASFDASHKLLFCGYWQMARSGLSARDF